MAGQSVLFFELAAKKTGMAFAYPSCVDLPWTVDRYPGICGIPIRISTVPDGAVFDSDYGISADSRRIKKSGLPEREALYLL